MHCVGCFQRLTLTFWRSIPYSLNWHFQYLSSSTDGAYMYKCVRPSVCIIVCLCVCIYVRVGVPVSVWYPPLTTATAQSEVDSISHVRLGSLVGLSAQMYVCSSVSLSALYYLRLSLYIFSSILLCLYTNKKINSITFHLSWLLMASVIQAM